VSTVLLDATNLASRSYHAARGAMSGPGGEPTGPLVLFVNALAMHASIEQPERFLACWDHPGPTWRETRYERYKAARRTASLSYNGTARHASFGLIKEFLDLSGIAQTEQPGLEADDLIAAAHHYARVHYEPVVILSADKDLLQLLDEDTEQVRFSGGHAATDRWTRARMIEELGYAPEHAAMVMALTGDPSDGIPGVAGLGPRKAVKMLTEHAWDLNSVCAALPYREADLARLSYDLVDLHSDLHSNGTATPYWNPVVRHDGSCGTPEQLAALDEFCDLHDLKNIKARLAARALWW
jgi:DNA polymerase-1